MIAPTLASATTATRMYIQPSAQPSAPTSRQPQLSPGSLDSNNMETSFSMNAPLFASSDLDIFATSANELTADMTIGQFLTTLTQTYQAQDVMHDENETFDAFNASSSHNNLEPSSMENTAYRQHNFQYILSDCTEDESELPFELAAMIAQAQSSTQIEEEIIDQSSTTSETEIRYYPTYTEGELCSSKSSSKLASWETSYGTLEECCDLEFSWDYRDCIGSLS